MLSAIVGVEFMSMLIVIVYLTVTECVNITFSTLSFKTPVSVFFVLELCLSVVRPES